MNEYLAICDHSYSIIPELVAISGVLDASSPNEAAISDYLKASWDKLRTVVQ